MPRPIGPIAYQVPHYYDEATLGAGRNAAAGCLNYARANYGDSGVYFGLRYFGFRQRLRLLKRWSRQYFVSSANQKGLPPR
jgi:hypothetical protein